MPSVAEGKEGRLTRRHDDAIEGIDFAEEYDERSEFAEEYGSWTMNRGQNIISNSI